MKILLYNDNPVVRKLVALSAQKTKDDLNVIWSIDELDDGSYDLLIVDDALYSDEVIAELKARIPFKTTLMMATRGSSVPAGFDKVIHKPFLPTDLVDLFSQIEKSITAPVEEPKRSETIKAINLEDELDDMGDDAISIDDLPDLGDLDDEDVSTEFKTNILDHEEVQEVQSLLDDEEAFSLDEDLLEGVGETPDTMLADDEIDHMLEEIEEEKPASEPMSAKVPEMDDLDALMDDLGEEGNIDNLDDMLLEDEVTGDAVEKASEAIEDVEEESGLDESFNDEFLEDEITENVAETMKNDEDIEALLAGFDDDIPADVTETHAEIPEMDQEEFEADEGFDESDIESMAASIEDESLLDDAGMDELEQQIQDAVSELDLEDLDIELGGEELDDLGIETLSGLDGLEGLEEIDEKEMKRAVGESVEDEPEVRIGHSEHASLDIEALSEAMGDEENTALYVENDIAKNETAASPADGVEALQVLLKTLSNEEVVKSLKGLNISININFGNNS